MAGRKHVRMVIVLIALWFPLEAGMRAWQVVEASEEVTGTVVHNEEVPCRMRNPFTVNLCYQPVFSVTDASGNVHRLPSDTSVYPAPEIGSTQTVYLQTTPPKLTSGIWWPLIINAAFAVIVLIGFAWFGTRKKPTA